MNLSFHPLADREFTEAAQFYEGKSTGLGRDFVNEIGSLLGLLRDYPELGRPVRGTLRALPARRFPFTLVYDVQPDRLLIVAVAHQRRRPQYWSGRAER